MEKALAEKMIDLAIEQLNFSYTQIGRASCRDRV